MTTDFDTEDAETRLFTVERDPLDGTCEVFRGRGSGGSLCGVHRIDHQTIRRKDVLWEMERISRREAYYTPEQ